MQKKFRKDNLEVLNVAIEGIIEALRTERNMKFHAFCGVLILVISIFLGINKLELIALSISISFVLVTELINTAIENFVDLVSPEYNIIAKRAKDVGAGAVFISATNAIIVGYLVFHKKLSQELKSFFEFLKNSHANVIVFILIFIVVIVIVIKTIFKKGRPLKGGIPSGHSALAGAVFTGIFFLTNDVKVFYLSTFLLILVMQSRVEGKIHTVAETIIGTFLGISITYIFLTLINF